MFSEFVANAHDPLHCSMTIAANVQDTPPVRVSSLPAFCYCDLSLVYVPTPSPNVTLVIK